MNLLDMRLKTVLSLVPQGSILLDIGTDHCKLPAEGLQSGRLAGAFAADVKQGPLDAAAKQLTALGLRARIPLFLSDGLRQIPKAVLEQVTAVTVAGMGGELMEQIIRTAPQQPPLWVLQPMSAIYELLDFLAAEGYRIQDAALAQDSEKFYRVFAVTKGDSPYPPDYFTCIKNDPLFLPYLRKEEARLLTAIEGLNHAKTPNEKRLKEAQQRLSTIRKAML